MKAVILKYYYHAVLLAVCIFIFNTYIRDPLIGSVFGISKEASIMDAQEYGKYNTYRNTFVYVGYLTYTVCFNSSVVVLFADSERRFNRSLVALVTVLAVFMCVLMILHYFDETPLFVMSALLPSKMCL